MLSHQRLTGQSKRLVGLDVYSREGFIRRTQKGGRGMHSGAAKSHGHAEEGGGRGMAMAAVDVPPDSSSPPDPQAKPLCKHCGVKPPNRRRGLCWTCYFTPGVRDLYPPDAKGRNSGKQELPSCWGCLRPATRRTHLAKDGWAVRKVSLNPGMCPMSECYCPECFAKYGWPPLVPYHGPEERLTRESMRTRRFVKTTHTFHGDWEEKR